MCDWFAEEAATLEWYRTRKMPEWAERIFSGSIIAAGNVQKEEELEQILAVANSSVDHYLQAVAETNNHVLPTSQHQNYYAQNQKQNPHTPRVMVSLGLSEEDVRIFIQECLFPEIR
jgi:hypothetical protein